MIRSGAVVLLLVLFELLPGAKAQEIETPKVELYGGYDYIRYNANPRINGVPLPNPSARTALVARLRTTHTAGLGSWANSAATHWRAKVVILHTRFRIYLGPESA